MFWIKKIESFGPMSVSFWNLYKFTLKESNTFFTMQFNDFRRTLKYYKYLNSQQDLINWNSLSLLFEEKEKLVKKKKHGARVIKLMLVLDVHSVRENNLIITETMNLIFKNMNYFSNLVFCFFALVKLVFDNFWARSYWNG